MERLTKRVDGIAVLESWAVDKDPVSIIQRLCNRLAAYEDLMERWKLRSIEEADRIFQRVNALGGTDLMAQYRAIGSIDHIRDLLQVEQGGRLVVLPWAAGDVIYEADPAHGVVKHTFAGEPAWMMHSYAVDDAGNEWYDGWGSSDETPFYKTREEAEAALAQKGGESDA